MIYQVPKLTKEDIAVLKLIEQQRERLRIYTQSNPRKWFGSLRKSTFARAIQGSNSIEGYHASIEDAMAAIDNEPPLDTEQEAWLAIKGYRDAMTYIIRVVEDPDLEISKQFLKSLHFMMIGFDLTKNPGQWRPGGIRVVDERSGEIKYEAPDASQVKKLMDELVAYLTTDDKQPIIVRAAMAHLNLTMIHPYSDGNGRMARALQTLVLAQRGLLSPVFSSIEEWLGHNTQEYYNVLAEVGKGEWNPHHNALPWVKFCLKAHYQQADTLIRRNEEYGLLFDEVQKIIDKEDLPERVTIPLFEAALGYRLTNIRYRSETEVSQILASRDLKRLCEKKLLTPKGENRGRTYRPTQKLKELRESTRIKRPIDDPYNVIVTQSKEAEKASEPMLPGLI